MRYCCKSPLIPDSASLSAVCYVVSDLSISNAAVQCLRCEICRRSRLAVVIGLKGSGMCRDGPEDE